MGGTFKGKRALLWGRWKFLSWTGGWLHNRIACLKWLVSH